jgi:hypothetical protein
VLFRSKGGQLFYYEDICDDIDHGNHLVYAFDSKADALQWFDEQVLLVRTVIEAGG